MKWEISTVLKLSSSLPPGLLGLPPAWRRLPEAVAMGACPADPSHHSVVADLIYLEACFSLLGSWSSLEVQPRSGWGSGRQRPCLPVPPHGGDRDTRAGCAAASAELSGELQSQSPVACRQGGLDTAGFVMAL